MRRALLSNVGTAALTIIGGVIVYTFGKMIARAFIEPLNGYRRLVMEIAGRSRCMPNIGELQPLGMRSLLTATRWKVSGLLRRRII